MQPSGVSNDGSFNSGIKARNLVNGEKVYPEDNEDN
jgi:hypothetical protein